MISFYSVIHLIIVGWQTVRTAFFTLLTMFGLKPSGLPAIVHPVSNNTGIIITGCSSGIGRDIALSLVRRGYTVFAGIRKQKDADQLESEVLSSSSSKGAGQEGILITVHLDVKLSQSINDAYELVDTWLQSNPQNRLTALINNAGIANALPLEMQDMETVEDVIDTNLLGMVRMTKRFLPLLRQFHGRLINVGSMNGSVGVPLMSIYSASKFAVEGLTDALRREVADQGVQVVLIKPGSVRTPVFAKSQRSAKIALVDADFPNDSREVEEKYRKMIDTSRLMMAQIPRRALDPWFVTDTVLHALESPFPQTRYLVGLDAIGATFLSQVLPDRVMDFVLWLLISIESGLSSSVEKITKAW